VAYLAVAGEVERHILLGLPVREAEISLASAHGDDGHARCAVRSAGGRCRLMSVVAEQGDERYESHDRGTHNAHQEWVCGDDFPI
jgi:hypothetical protein